MPQIPDDLRIKLVDAKTETIESGILGSNQVIGGEWHDVLMGLFVAIPKAIQIDEFRITYRLVEHLGIINVALNSWANWKIEAGIGEFNALMESVRREIGEPHAG